MGAAFFVAMTPKKVGELNGKWSVLLRVMLVAGPCVLTLLTPWVVWVTSELYNLRAQQQVILQVYSIEVDHMKELITEIKGDVHDLAKKLDERK